MATSVTADLSRVKGEEEDVSPYAGLSVNDAYDLALYLAEGSASVGVLVVTMNLQFFFEDGESEEGEALTWEDGEKQKYIDDFLGAIWDVWNEPYSIRTDSTSTTLKEVKVQFRFKTLIEGTWIYDHWELEVTKTDVFKVSVVSPGSGNVTLDSKDVDYASFKPQRGASHEFGHMLALDDEYLNEEGEPVGNPHWTTDSSSIMLRGEQVRPRHLTPFAYWITEQYEDLADEVGREIVFYVDDGAGGKWTVDGGSGFKNAKLT